MFYENYFMNIKEQHIGKCGAVCSLCPRYTATKDGNSKKLKYLAELWHRLGLNPSVVGIEDIKCDGCSTNKNCLYKINQCRQGEKVENCGDCNEYPCNSINDVFADVDKIKEKYLAECSKIEYRIINEAFLLRKKILEEIRNDK